LLSRAWYVFGELGETNTVQAAEQVIGCTGHPAESHVTMWMKLTKDIKHHRCPHCGSGTYSNGCMANYLVYQLEHLGMDNDH